ncbi:hypothetical protein [Curtobacterium sp. MCBD17_019]|uniref:hypothetical protein n=1 Tax=Curtobacterium sp. MCBD17_019 TaxID=2175669 RepID=UPI000DAABEED|nr:hypothetical protein [Curtobacterium sp. MCBD17_019]PZE77102.1 hypothetical protein DEI82_04030 [Curtobacterium sp. MCBD17_019]
MTDDEPLAYLPDKPRDVPTPDELRARIPGWGADLDPADRPAVPRLRFDPSATGAHWTFPERQPGAEGRERSIEHAFVTPVFGTAQPLSGVSGLIRRAAYGFFSEGRAAHWLLLIAGDRVNVAEARIAAALQGSPDRVVHETGIAAERGGRGIAERLRSSRSDTHHTWIDPLLTMGPYVLVGLVVTSLVRGLVRRR